MKYMGILQLQLGLFMPLFFILRILLSILVLSIPLILSWSLVALSSGSTSGEFLNYQGNGFSFNYPATWKISGSGSQVAGNLSITNSCYRINIIWMRDPGFALDSILNQTQETYSQGEVEVVSLLKGEISVQEKKAKTMDLLYKFKEYRAKKHLAVWISNGSDRLFLASMSACEGGYVMGEEAFKQILDTFRDEENKEVTLGPRSTQDDAWAIVLGDLLASYHYRDQGALKSMSVYAEAVHSLIPINGSYSLFSEETIRSEISEKVIIRVAAVQRILRNFGYDARIIQKSGLIWILVQDPSDKWQAVSLNPRETWRMLGVLTNKSEGYKGRMYLDIEELADDSFPKVKVPHDLDSYIQKDCDPSRYTQLKHPVQANSGWLDRLKSILNGQSYPKKYQENIFDCSNTSQICWALLEAKGYDARLMFTYKDNLLGQHMWVVIRYPYEDESYVAVEATNTNGNSDLIHLGKVTWDDEYYYGIMYNTSMQYSWLHPEEGMWLAN